MKQTIKAAYDRCLPDEAHRAELYARVLQTAQARSKKSPAGRLIRRIALAAAITALLAALSMAGYAAYQRWILPVPETYVPNESGGIYAVQDRIVYDNSEWTDQAHSPADEEQSADAALLARALEILEQAGVETVSPERMTLTRQENLYWGREEAEISIPQADDQTITVKFDAQSGVFLGMSGIQWVLSDTAACQTQEQADALAERYYHALPVEQGYVLRHVEHYDEQYWSYDFCREAAPGIYSAYECVRIAINPVSGALNGVNVFYVPLLDDHVPEDEALTREQAQAAAQACPELHLDGYRLREAEITVGLPNWIFTPYEAANTKISGVTRLCWSLVYDRPDSEFADEIRVLVDLYTGQILGGDQV